MRKHPLGWGREQGKSRSLELSRQSPGRNDEDAESGETLKKGVFTPRGIDFYFIHRYGNQLVRTRTQHTRTRTQHTYLPYFIYLLSLFRFCCCRLQHHTPDAVFLGGFVALLLSLLPTVMGRFVEVERELNWTHSVGLNIQYDFFYVKYRKAGCPSAL